MTTNPENIDTSAERVRKNLIADLMREAARQFDFHGSGPTSLVERLLDAAEEIERQEQVAEVQEHPYGHKSAWLVQTVPPENFYVGMKLYAHPQPASDVSALVEALENAYMALIGYLPSHRNDITDAAISQCEQALAAHRKGGGE